MFPTRTQTSPSGRRYDERRKNAYLVIGLDDSARRYAQNLAEKGKQVIAIDRTRQLVEEMAKWHSAAQADATDSDALTKASTADIAIVAIGSNIEASILATTILQTSTSFAHVIARGRHPRAGIIARVGANKVVFPERDMRGHTPHSSVDVPVRSNSRFTLPRGRDQASIGNDRQNY